MIRLLLSTVRSTFIVMRTHLDYNSALLGKSELRAKARARAAAQVKPAVPVSGGKYLRGDRLGSSNAYSLLTSCLDLTSSIQQLVTADKQSVNSRPGPNATQAASTPGS
jgi:hypothetical protein